MWKYEREFKEESAFLEPSNYSWFKIGILVNAPLRQAKNLFIGTVVKVGILSAIPGDPSNPGIYKVQSKQDLLHL